jgi:hypothetical protein
MPSKSLAFAFAAAMVVTTVAGGAVVAANADSAPLDAPPDDQTEPSDSAPDMTQSRASDSPSPATAPNATFPDSLEKVVYERVDEHTRRVTFVTDAHRFTMEPRAVGFADAGATIPRSFSFTPGDRLDLDEGTVSEPGSNGTLRIDIPDDADIEPAGEFDPDVPVADAPEEVRFDAANGTVTVTTADGTHTLAPTAVVANDTGTVTYHFDEVALVHMVDADDGSNGTTVPFPRSLERVSYDASAEDAPPVGFTTDGHYFRMSPTVVSLAGGPGTVPTLFDFTPLLELDLGEGAVSGGESTTDGVRETALPENATGDPVREFDPEVPVADAPEEVRYDAADRTLTVVTADGTETFDVEAVSWTDDGIVSYHLEQPTVIDVVLQDGPTDGGLALKTDG